MPPRYQIPVDRMRRALEQAGGAIVVAARDLHVAPNTLRREMALAHAEDPSVDLLTYAAELRHAHGVRGRRDGVTPEQREAERQRIIDAIQAGGTEEEIRTRLGPSGAPWSHHRFRLRCAEHGIVVRDVRPGPEDPDVERERIVEALVSARWSLSGAAARLGYSRIKLDARIAALGLEATRAIATSRARRGPPK